MPWEVTGPVQERERFSEAHLSGFYTITELADGFGMSRRSCINGSHGITSAE